MLVPLFMWEIGLMCRSAFFISPYMEANRQACYEGLLSVSGDDDWTGWCRFFLNAVRVQAEDNLARAQAIIDLHEEMKRRVPDVARTRYAVSSLVQLRSPRQRHEESCGGWVTPIYFTKPYLGGVVALASSCSPASCASRKAANS